MKPEAEPPDLRCPHCVAGEPSVWDPDLFHYAHPHPTDKNKLTFCHDPWRERCRQCSADIVDGQRFCGAACSQIHEMGQAP